MTVPSPTLLDLAEPREIISRGREFQRNLCTDLERLADQLGGHVDLAFCDRLLDQINTCMPLCHRDEETVYRIVFLSNQRDSRLRACVKTAVQQHAAIEASLLEISEPLSEYSRSRLGWERNAFGFLLRHCFVALRYHLDWEDAIFFQEDLLEPSAVDLAYLRAALKRNRMLRGR